MGNWCIKDDSQAANYLSDQASAKEAKQARLRRKHRRQAAVQELIDTEITYVDSLNICIAQYHERLITETKLINAEDVSNIFNDMKTIYKLNHTFLEDLQSDGVRIGDIFVKFCPYFRMYQNYCNSFDQATQILTQSMTNDAFCSLLSEISQANDQKTLQSLLITPIQRLPRYKLSLSEIIKNTENDHPDLMDLHRALELVEETTLLINERMKEFDARQQVRSIESRFTKLDASLVKPHRIFIYEGLLTRVDKTGKDREYTFFLFNDLLCYASGNKETLKMHTQLAIDEAFFIEDIPYSDRYNDRSFEIHSAIKSFMVHANDHQGKKVWMDQLKQVTKKRQHVIEKDHAAPLFVPDDWSDECQIGGCDTKFSFINRRHHCRYCGKLICAKCGNYELASRTDRHVVVKPVCSVCFDEYKTSYPAPTENIKQNDMIQTESYSEASKLM
eukprot:260648_1